MTLHKEEITDVEPVQIWSVKELEAEFTPMLKAYHDKETEFNWEARDQAITRLRGILRGNATDPQYYDALLQCMKQMVDGIIKAVESLRTQLAVKALLLVTDIGVYMGNKLDSYITEHILMCMIRCSSLTKKMVANASLDATKMFLRHTQFHSKFINMLNLSMQDKNSQVRLFAIAYTKTLLETHGHRDQTRLYMDRHNATDHFETIITKGLNDATPAVKEASREAFWLFWEYWRDRGDHILRKLPTIAQKQLEKSKTIIMKPSVAQTSRGIHSPAVSPRAPSAIGCHDISPSNSSASTGSISHEPHHTVYHQQIKRSMSPRAPSPHLRSYGSPPPVSISSQMQQSPLPSNSISPSPPTSFRKTRVPTLNRKKSSVGLIKRKPASNFMNLLSSDDPMQRTDGLVLLGKKLAAFPYMPIPDLASIHLDVPNAPPVEGESLKSLILSLWDDHYDYFSSWDGMTYVLFRLLTFEECLPKLILDANVDDSARRTEADTNKYQDAQLGLLRAKLFLSHQHSSLVDTLFTSLIQYGGFVGHTPAPKLISSRKDVTRLPANRRKLTKQFLEWMDELVTPLIGLDKELDKSLKAYESVPAEFIQAATHASEWFEVDDHVRQVLAILLPLITTSTSGTMWHAPLVNFMNHIRLLNQRLFEMVTATYDEYSVNKICRVLGIHIRLEPPVAVVPQGVIAADVEKSPKEVLEPKEPIETLDEQRPKEILEEQKPKSISEEQQTKDILDDQQTRDILDEQQTKDILDEQQPENIFDEQQPEEILDQQLPDEVQTEPEIPLPEEPANVDQVVPYTKEEMSVPLAPLQQDFNLDLSNEPPVAVDEVLYDNPPAVLDVIERPLVGKLSIQERNTILDHDITPPYLKEEQPIVTNLMAPEQEKTVPDYFISVSGTECEHTQSSYITTNESSLPADMLYANDDNDASTLDIRRTVPTDAVAAKATETATATTATTTAAATTTTTAEATATIGTVATAADMTTITDAATEASMIQTPLPDHQPMKLACSTPNTDKYPVPAHVAFFAPEKVNFPNPVFKHNQRTLTASQSSSTSTTTATNRNPKDKAVLLYSLIDKLKLKSSSDHQGTFRKLTRLVKEVPIRRRWDQGGIDESGSETWAGAQGDAGNFVETVQVILPLLSDTKLVLVALECLRQLAVTQAGLFRYYERKVDERGMTLESQLMEKLLEIRSNDSPTICIAAEDALDAVLGTLNPPTAFEMLMAFIIHRLLISPHIEYSTDVRYHPVGSAFLYLSKWVKEMNDTFYIDEWLGKGGVNAFFKGMNHSMINIRKSCVEAIVAFHEVIGDDIYVFLGDLREDQLNLIRHYVAKAAKKKTSLRNLRDNGQF